MIEAEVRDNKEFSRFEIQVEGHTAFAEYELEDGVMTFTHTASPSAVAGRGVATALIRGALQQVRARGLKVVPLCSFVGAFFKRHPEFQDLLLK
jgi:hypothetical protein